MLGIRSIARVRPQPASYLLSRGAPKIALSKRTYANANEVDITKIPLKQLGCFAEFYVPPRLRDCPVTSWHRLVIRRFAAFAMNTFSVYRFRKDTNLKLQFNDWKERTVEEYVKTNKIFAKACSLRKQHREPFIKEQLDGVAGTHVIQALSRRVLKFPANTKVNWNLLSIEENPKVISVAPIPNKDEVTALLQLVTKVKTKQEMIVDSNGKTDKTERVVTDYLVSTIDPFTKEQLLVGSLFESGHMRGVQPEFDPKDVGGMMAFQKRAGDIYREPPKAIASN